MHGRIALLLLIPLQEREIGDPGKGEHSLIRKPELPRELDSKLPQHLAHHLGAVGSHQHQISGRSSTSSDHCLQLAIGDEFGDRRMQPILAHLDGYQPLRAQIARHLRHLIYLAARVPCTPWGDNGLDLAASLSCPAEGLKASVTRQVGEIDQTQVKAHVRLVAPKLGHGLRVRKPRERYLCDALV